jgi:hypothetical protein
MTYRSQSTREAASWKLTGTLVVWLADAEPYDLTDVDLSEYRGIVAPWNDWPSDAAQCTKLAAMILKS